MNYENVAMHVNGIFTLTYYTDLMLQVAALCVKRSNQIHDEEFCTAKENR